MQYTRLENPLLALTRDGLASDAELSHLAELAGSVVAVRVVIPPRNSHGCAGPTSAGPALVALDPADAAVPDAQRGPVRKVGPGLAVADEAWAFLAGGTIALVGLDVVVDHVAPLGSRGRPGPVLLSLSDLALSLSHTKPEHLPPMRTVVVLRGFGSPVFGWEAMHFDGDAVPLMAGLPALHSEPALT